MELQVEAGKDGLCDQCREFNEQALRKYKEETFEGIRGEARREAYEFFQWFMWHEEATPWIIAYDEQCKGKEGEECEE